MTPLRKRFQNHLTFKRFSPKTHEAYIGAVKGLANHYHKSPDKLSDEQIQDYFVYLLEEGKYAWSSCNVIFCGVKLFYEEILNRDTRTVIPPRPRQKQLPTILSQAEVSKLINACKKLKHRTLILGVYSGGLRVREAVRHCFATHLMEQGVQIYAIKRMMGHVALSTTAGYMHVSNELIASIKSPLDFLAMEMDQASKTGNIQ